MNIANINSFQLEMVDLAVLMGARFYGAGIGFVAVADVSLNPRVGMCFSGRNRIVCDGATHRPRDGLADRWAENTVEKRRLNWKY